MDIFWFRNHPSWWEGDLLPFPRKLPRSSVWGWSYSFPWKIWGQDDDFYFGK